MVHRNISCEKQGKLTKGINLINLENMPKSRNILLDFYKKTTYGRKKMTCFKKLATEEPPNATTITTFHRDNVHSRPKIQANSKAAPEPAASEIPSPFIIK